MNLTTLDEMLGTAQHDVITKRATAQMPTNVNQEWFKEKLRHVKISQRQLAKKMGLDPASVSYMLSGKRSMSMNEAQSLAGHLLVPVTEVMRQAGIDVLDDVRKVPIAGYIGKEGSVTLLPNGTHDTVVAPADCPANTFALQMRVVNSYRDGWLYFVTGVQQPPQGQLDKMCVVALKDGGLIITVIKRGYKRELYNLVLMHESEARVLENKEVAWAARVLWIQPT